jgi:hypothetical protein
MGEFILRSSLLGKYINITRTKKSRLQMFGPTSATFSKKIQNELAMPHKNQKNFSNASSAPAATKVIWSPTSSAVAAPRAR